MNHKKNQHYINTHNTLINTMIEQFLKNEKVTVNTLCNIIGINHSTFYLHFSSIKELIDEIYKLKLDEIYDECVKQGCTMDKVDYKLMNALFTHTQENQNFYKMMLKRGFSKEFPYVYKSKWENFVDSYIKKSLKEEQDILDLRVHCIQASYLALLTRWLDTNCKVDKEQIIKLALEYTTLK